MSRLFDDAASNELSAAAVLTAVPLSMACWFNSDSAAANQTLMSLGNNGTDGYFRIAAMGSVAGDPIRAQTQDDLGSPGQADSSSGYSINTWHHACGVFAAVDSRAAYIDGGSKGTNATSINSPTPDFTSIGSLKRSTSSLFMSGNIAEAAVWNAALTDAEVLSLARGIRPCYVRPASLVAYWPLYGKLSPEIDTWGKFDLTVTGAVAAAHPRMHVPFLRQSRFVQAGAAQAAGYPLLSELFVGSAA